MSIEKLFRCDVCGQFISLLDIECGKAQRHLISGDSDYSVEDFETLCAQHKSNQERS